MKNWELKLVLVSLVLLALMMLIGFFVGRNSKDSESTGTNSCKRYVSKDTYRCQLIDFRCEEDENMFTDEIGCGCEKLNC